MCSSKHLEAFNDTFSCHLSLVGFSYDIGNLVYLDGDKTTEVGRRKIQMENYLLIFVIYLFNILEIFADIERGGLISTFPVGIAISLKHFQNDNKYFQPHLITVLSSSFFCSLCISTIQGVSED